MVYPIDVRVDYGDGSRSRGYAVLGILFFLKALLLIPHLVALWVVSIVTYISAWIGYWVILFTGRQPEGISRLLSGFIRWYTRSAAWLYATTDVYPEFGFDDGAEGAQTTISIGDGERNRALAASGVLLIKPLLALPHLIIIGVLGYAAGVAAWIGFWIILFTGRLPEGLHQFFTGLLRWSARAFGWVGSLTDEYPPFSFD